ncbi:periaxin [Erythrolamprus reginae]|uniref:periaxin n=1 Tax=Erythrolamprus reginae TaxID=121349 RepID=UPI00396C30E2
MTTEFIAMEKTIEASELLELVVETEAGAGARGLSVAGGGKEGLFVKDVLKDSPAARVLSLQEGDQLLSARVYFDNIKCEDALQILKWAEPYKISFCLKRLVPSADVSRKPGAAVFELKGPKAKLAKLNIQSLSSLKKRRKEKKRRRRKRMAAQGLQEAEAGLAAGKPGAGPVDVEFSFPRFSRLRKARSAGAVAAAEPSPGVSRKLSSLETKRHRLKFPRLKVKEAVAAEARLALGLPHAGLGLEETGKGAGQGKAFPFTRPFSKTKKPKEEAGAKAETGFHAPQVEFALPKVGPEGRSLQASPEVGSLAVSAPRLGWSTVEAVLPTGSAGVLDTHPGLLQAGLKLPAAEVEAPKVDVGLALPRLEGAAPEAVPKREGFTLRVPKLGISAEEVELKLPLMKAPALEMALGESPQKVLEGQPRPGRAAPSLATVVPGVDLQLPFAKGKTGRESPDISGGVSSASLGSKLPQVEVSLGSPKADPMEGSLIQLPGLESSLREKPLESREAAGATGVRVPALDISAPKVQDMHLCKALGEPAAPSGRAKAKEAAEGPGFKFPIPQISLPKFDFPVKAAPSPPPVQVKRLKPEGDSGTKVDTSLLAVKVPGLPLLKVPRPELGISVEKPEVEVTAPPAPLSFPFATVPALDIQPPNIGVELDLAKRERDVSKQGPKAQEVTRGTLDRDLEVEISLPKCVVSQPELEPGMRSIEGPALAGTVAKFPKVDLSLEKLPADSEGPKTDLEEARMKLPTVEIPPITLTGITSESRVKVKTSRFALSKFSISGPKVWSKMSPDLSVSGVDGREAANLGSKLKLPKFGISFPKSRWEAEGGEVKPALEAKGEAAKETPGSRMKLPTVEVDLGRPQGVEGDGQETSPGLPGVQFKGPKLALLSFGSKGQEEEWGALETEEAKAEKEAKASKFRIASLGLLRREAEAKAKKAPGSPKEKPKGPFGKMPQLKDSSSLKAHQLAPGAEAGLRVQGPSVEIAVPGSPLAEGEATGEKRAGEVAKEGGLKRAPPSLRAPVPSLELDIGLPAAGQEGGVLQAAKIKLPKVELARLGKGQGEEAEVALQLLGKAGEKELAGVGTKVGYLPKVDISLPKAWLPEGELPPAQVDLGLVQGAEFKVPSMGLPKLSAPKVKAPQLELDVGLEGAGVVGTPSVKWPEPGASGSGREEEDLVRVPQLELKPPKFRGSADAVLDSEAGQAKEGGLKVTGRPLGLGRLEAEAGLGMEEGRFQLKLPSLSVSKPEAELSLGVQPLCPPAEGAALAFRVPEVSFSGDQERGEEATAALEGGLGGTLTIPKIGIAVGGAAGTAWGTESATSPSQRGGGGGEPEGKKSVFKVPGLKISAPSLKTHAEYEVGGPPWEAGKWPRVRIPAFGLSLPRVGLEAPEGLVGQEAEAKKGFLALGRPKGEEASAGLLAREEGSQAKAAKLKVRAPFGVSISRPTWAAELNGEAEETSSRLKVPRLGFSKAEGERVEEGPSKLGKIPLPQVELLPPSKGAKADPELSLKLVKAEEAKEEGHGGITVATALKAAKFKPPRLTLSGFKKRNGELPPEAPTAPGPQAGEASVKATTKGEPSSKFKFPKLVLSSRSQELLETPEDQQAGSFRLPAVAFSAESGPEEGGAPPRKPMEKEAVSE